MSTLECWLSPKLRHNPTFLLLDRIDVALAHTPAATLFQTILKLKDLCQCTFVFINGDSALTRDAALHELEYQHQSFLMLVAHASARLLSVRPLQTGLAKDVTGILRITYGGSTYGNHTDVGSLEVLYFADETLHILHRS